VDATLTVRVSIPDTGAGVSAFLHCAGCAHACRTRAVRSLQFLHAAIANRCGTSPRESDQHRHMLCTVCVFSPDKERYSARQTLVPRRVGGGAHHALRLLTLD
jgi:hypothetical protein